MVSSPVLHKRLNKCISLHQNLCCQEFYKKHVYDALQYDGNINHISSLNALEDESGMYLTITNNKEQTFRMDLVTKEIKLLSKVQQMKAIRKFHSMNENPHRLSVQDQTKLQHDRNFLENHARTLKTGIEFVTCLSFYRIVRSLLFLNSRFGSCEQRNRRAEKISLRESGF